MTKQSVQGSGGPDDHERIHDAVMRLRREAITRREAMVEILFSPDGYSRASTDTVPGMDPWSARIPNTHYFGYPFRIVGKQTQPVAIRCVPGGSPEAKAARNESRVQPTLQGVMYGRAKMMLADEATLKALGQAATAAQICDFITAYTLLNPNNDLSVALNDAVRQYGRFY